MFFSKIILNPHHKDCFYKKNKVHYLKILPSSTLTAILCLLTFLTYPQLLYSYLMFSEAVLFSLDKTVTIKGVLKDKNLPELNIYILLVFYWKKGTMHLWPSGTSWINTPPYLAHTPPHTPSHLL